MKKITFYLILSLICAFIGSLFYAFHQDWIVVNLPGSKQKEFQQIAPAQSHKKKVTLYFWHKDKWHQEKIELVWSTDQARALQLLASTWLNLMDEDQIMHKKISLQTALIDSAGNAYLSFDRYPFTKNQTTFDKLQWIEGLLKTLRDNDIKIQGVQFLIHHQPIIDYHLDFSKPWPMQGFSQAV